MQADGLDAVARVGVPGEHRGILSDRHVFRILKHWLHAGEPDPFYNPLNDYVILPTVYEIETHQEQGFELTSLKEEWEILANEQDAHGAETKSKPVVSSLCVSEKRNDIPSRTKACATVTVHPPDENKKQRIELNAVSVSING